MVRTALNANISRWRRRRREISVPDPGRIADLPAGGEAADSAGALAAVALAVTTLLPASHQAGHPARAQLAAWTVTRQPDGSIRVALRELRDPSRLQRRLRAGGQPASVSGLSGNPACHGNLTPQQRAAADHVYRWQQSGYYTVVIIHPSALPASSGVMIDGTFRPPVWVFGVGLVHASQHCTGS